MQIALPCADRHRDVDDIGMAGSAAEQTDSSGCRVIQGDDLGALVAEQGRDARLPRATAPRLSNYSGRHGNSPLPPVNLI